MQRLESMDHELDELKREFLAEAEEKVREIESTLGSEPTPVSLERVGYLAHQLKGSGGSYGYQKISTDAAAIEKALEALKNGSPSVTHLIQEHVGSLHAEIDKRVLELRI